MRRFILFTVFLLILSVPGRADKVTPQQAAAVADRFLKAESPATKTARGSLRLAGTWPQVATKGAASEPALYLFERDGGGYVVVAADDVSLPVIGYSATGSLTKKALPCNLRFMLDWHASMIDYARTQGLRAPEETKAQWLSADGNEGEGVLLETAHWDQEGDPYNSLIPTLNGRKCPAGCVASALAIILRYHQWPERGTGTLPGYYWSSGRTRIEDHPLGYVYDWNQMPLVYEAGKYTEEQGRQVAQLMYDMAIMSEMEFHPSGSGADGDVTLRLSTYFGYDKQIRFLDWDYFNKDVWEGMIRSELDAARPVFYGGLSYSGEGHGFVVDGYKGAFFSLNYGWGYGSEYYLLRPPVPLTEDKVTVFCKWACMATHIYPDRGGEVYASFSCDTFTPFPWDFRSKSFTMGSRDLNVYASGKVETTLGYVLFDREGRCKEVASDPVRVSSDDPTIPELNCRITGTIEEGDCLKLAQQVDGAWEPINQTDQSILEFHPGKPLSELVCLDYTLIDEDYQLIEIPYLYLRGAKDIYWEIWTEDFDKCLATSKNPYATSQIEGEYYSMFSKWDSKTNQYRAEIGYPAGTYRLLLRNFDEEKTLYIKL